VADPYAASRGDLITQTFWDGLEKFEFLLQVCDDCSDTWFPAMKICPGCHSIKYHWRPVSGVGRVWTYSRVEMAPTPELQAEVPYWLVVVELAEGPQVLGRLNGVSADSEVWIGMEVALVIDPADEPGARTRYSFEPAAAPARRATAS
jgi:uncharacterized OB-fold protein